MELSIPTLGAPRAMPDNRAMSNADFALPIDAVLPDVITALRDTGRFVLQAPPGAGKTTRVPLAMLDAGLTQGRILMLEPRRLAARAAAARMAESLGEETGQTVGFRVRGASAVSKSTRIEVVTEGILTRMLQDNPDLPGVERGGHGHQHQVVAQRARNFERQREAEIGVERAFVKFVEDHRADAG
ncbi:hypothetical protein A3734_18540 [Sulfitobacter sp. HI0054]|nr:hypothetical protein A3734_18540 [Sulfitobacter sp. HI0054]